MSQPGDHEARRRALETELGEPITCDGLTRDFRIFQRRRGHRHSTDDLLTAWYAASAGPEPARVLDLGTGIGSVALSLAWRFPEASLSAIEVQPISFRLLRENVQANGVAERVSAHLGDLRELRAVLGDAGTFELVTGTPPYFDLKNGIVSPDAQRAAARFELAGDVHDYCAAAHAVLDETGRFVFCFPTAQHDRAVDACSRAGLSIVTWREVIPRQGLPALFTLYATRKDTGERPPCVRQDPFLVRDASGAQAADLTAARALFGLAG